LLELRDAYEFWQTEGDEKQLREILIPLEHAMPHVKKVFVKDSAIYNITCGAPVYTPGICRIQKGIRKGDLVAVCSLKEELVALGIARMSSEEMLEKEQGSAIRTDRVFMPKGIYPKA
jgi:H/ACA ribonucleoprotein complex subunit 4